MNGHYLGVESTDVALWDRARFGDGSAFAVLFERHARSVCTFCFRRTGHWSSAEDLTSLVFLEAWRHRCRVELQRDSALPYLLGIATNLSRNHHRSLRRQQRAVVRLAPDDVAIDPADDAAPRLDAERRVRTVLQLIEQLPADEQDVLAICAWAGLSYADAADALRVPIGTVRSRLARARSRLRQLEFDLEPTPSFALMRPSAEVTQ